MNASLCILGEIHGDDVSVQSIAQKTADIAAMLGQASHELSLKRRVFIRSVINSEYKDLRSSSQPVTEFLFGDNLPQVVKELNLANKLGSRLINKHSYSRSRSYPGNKEYYNFFNCYLAAPRPPLSHYRGNSLTHPMLITAFLHFRPEGHREPCSEVGSLSPVEHLAGFEPGTFQF